MDFSLSEEQRAIQSAVGDLCRAFDDDYWHAKDSAGGFPEDFYRGMAQAGWLGIAMPVEYGGAGLGILEAALMMEAVSGSGAGLSGASAIFAHVRRLRRLARQAVRSRLLPKGGSPSKPPSCAPAQCRRRECFPNLS